VTIKLPLLELLLTVDAVRFTAAAAIHAENCHMIAAARSSGNLNVLKVARHTRLSVATTGDRGCVALAQKCRAKRA